MADERCLFCDAPASRFCDFAIALVDGGIYKPKKGPPYRITTMEAMTSTSYTCDAPFCDKHGRVVGFVCAGKDSDTFDHCAGCQGRSDGRKGLMTPEQIAVIRKQMHAGYRRARIQSTPTTRGPSDG